MTGEAVTWGSKRLILNPLSRKVNKRGKSRSDQMSATLKVLWVCPTLSIKALVKVQAKSFTIIDLLHVFGVSFMARFVGRNPEWQRSSWECPTLWRVDHIYRDHVYSFWFQKCVSKMIGFAHHEGEMWCSFLSVKRVTIHLTRPLALMVVLYSMHWERKYKQRGVCEY